MVCDTDERFPCAANEELELPDITFTLEKTEFSLSPQFYIYKVDDQCTARVFKNDHAFYILGIPFMKV